MEGLYGPGRQTLHGLPSSAPDLQGALCQTNVFMVATLSLTTQFLYGWTQKGGGLWAPLATLQKQRNNRGSWKTGTSQGTLGLCTEKTLSSVEVSKLKAVIG